MMTALLLYAYSQGVYSSRRIARGCEERLDFLAVTAMNRAHSTDRGRSFHTMVGAYST